MDYIILDFLVHKESIHDDPDHLFYEQVQQWYKQPFTECCEQILKNHALDQSTNEEIKAYVEAFEIQLEGEAYTPDTHTKLNAVLRSRESYLRLQWADQGNHTECIVGTVDETQLDEFTIMRVTSQIGSSHRLLIPMVAMINEHDIMLREPCVDAMVQFKWEPMLSCEITMVPLMETKAHQIGQWLREAVIQHYRDSNQALVHLKNDCIDNVLHHEYGHAVIQHYSIPKPYAAIAECFQVFSPINGMILLLECLADIAPIQDNKAGVLTKQWLLSNTDDPKAVRCLFMYFSDIWFFDTSETSLLHYSEILSLVMTHWYATSSNQMLDMFATRKDSVLQIWVNRVVETIQQFMAHFLSDTACQYLLQINTYHETVKETKAIFKSLYVEQKTAIDRYLKTQEENVVKACYSDLKMDHLYHSDASIRRDKLFDYIIETCQINMP